MEMTSLTDMEINRLTIILKPRLFARDQFL